MKVDPEGDLVRIFKPFQAAAHKWVVRGHVDETAIGLFLNIKKLEVIVHFISSNQTRTFILQNSILLE